MHDYWLYFLVLSHASHRDGLALGGRRLGAAGASPRQSCGRQAKSDRVKRATEHPQKDDTPFILRAQSNSLKGPAPRCTVNPVRLCSGPTYIFDLVIQIEREQTTDWFSAIETYMHAGTTWFIVPGNNIFQRVVTAKAFAFLWTSSIECSGTD